MFRTPTPYTRNQKLMAVDHDTGGGVSNSQKPANSETFKISGAHFLAIIDRVFWRAPWLSPSRTLESSSDSVLGAKAS